MLHESPLLSLLVVGLGLAFVLGAIAVRFKMSPLAGYLIAGVIVGPFTPGFVADAGLAAEIAEVGVMLLMFGVGLHFSPKDLLSVRAVAVPVTFIQIGTMMVLGLGLGLLMGWSIEAGVVFGLSLGVASTVVSLRVLQEKRMIQTDRGRLSVGWLVVEDIVTILAMVLLPTWAQIRSEVQDTGEMSVLQLQDVGLALAITIGKVLAFVLIMLLIGKRVVPWLLHQVVHMGSRELFRLAVLVIALGVAAGASVFFGISFALGALFAGLIMAESELSQQAANETLPLRDAFAVLFFVSVGMLFDPMVLVQNPWPLLATVTLVVVLRTGLSVAMLRLFGQTSASAWQISATRSQIAEFSFILAGLGVSLGLLPEAGRDLILGTSIISILLSPLVFLVADRLTPKVVAAEAAPPKPPPPPGRAVLVGYGRVGSLIGQALEEAHANYAVIEERDTVVEQLQLRGIAAFVGNGNSVETMNEAQIDAADIIFVTVPNGFESGGIVELARKLNPKIRILARAHSDDEIEHLQTLGADVIISGEQEIAEAMISSATRVIPKRSIVNV